MKKRPRGLQLDFPGLQQAWNHGSYAPVGAWRPRVAELRLPAPVNRLGEKAKQTQTFEASNMKEEIVTALSAAAFVAFAFGANAGPPDSPQGGTAPSTPMAQPSGPSGPSSAESSRPEGAQTGQPSSKQEGVTERNKAAATGAKDQMDRDRKSAETGDKDQMDRHRKSAETGDKDQMDRDRKSAETGDKDQMNQDRKSAETGDKDQMDEDRKSAETGDKDQMDRDRKVGDRTTAKIDSSQKQKVRSYFSQNRPTANRIEKSRVSVSIGVPLPVGIALAPLPANIIVLAADCPLQYFVWGDDVVLVDSCSREVVDIIPNIG